jgi:hypothetical protein
MYIIPHLQHFLIKPLKMKLGREYVEINLHVLRVELLRGPYQNTKTMAI